MSADDEGGTPVKFVWPSWMTVLLAILVVLAILWLLGVRFAVVAYLAALSV